MKVSLLTLTLLISLAISVYRVIRFNSVIFSRNTFKLAMLYFVLSLLPAWVLSEVVTSRVAIINTDNSHENARYIFYMNYTDTMQQERAKLIVPLMAYIYNCTSRKLECSDVEDGKIVAERSKPIYPKSVTLVKFRPDYYWGLPEFVKYSRKGHVYYKKPSGYLLHR